LLDIISSKEARENFLEFICDHHSELERWQSYYQERFRIRIIEWLRQNKFEFVFEEDLEMTKSMVEKLKLNTFEAKVGKDLVASRKIIQAKAKTYYSSEALNPRPKRGRPPKQVAKVETEPQFSTDIFVTVPKAVKPFLFLPEYQAGSSAFTISSKFSSEADLLAHRKREASSAQSLDFQEVNQKLQALRSLSSQWLNDSQKPLPEKAVSSVVKQAPRAPVADEFEFEPKKNLKQSRYDLKEQKALENSFFERRKEKSDKAKLPPEKKLPEKKVPSKPVQSSKARLRPLTKKVAAPQSKAKSQVKAKPKPLRHLRRAKKR
jgi:hypothetical protein